MATRQRGQVITNADASYSIRYYLPSGRRKQEGTFRTKTGAERRLREVLRQIDSGLYRDELTFDALADRWLAVYDASPSTRMRVTGQVRLARAEFGGVPLRKITPEQVAAWRMTITRGQRHQTHGVLRQVLEAGVRWGYLAVNPARLVPNPSPKRPEVATFRDWEDVERVAAHVAEWGALIIFAVGTGLRPSEWCALDTRDVDLAGRVLRVERSWTERGGLVAYGKTIGSRRRVPLRGRVIDALRDAMPRRGLVFPAARGGHVRLHNWRARVWTPALDALGFDPMVPYAMRHTYAAWSLAAGIGVFSLARRMGTSVEMIDRTYGHLVHDADAVESDRLDEWDANGR